MKSTPLTETIRIQRQVTEINDYGTPTGTGLSVIATVRARRMDATTEEFLETGGATDEETVAFRIRFLDGIANADELVWQGQTFNIRQITPLGRRKWLDLRCTRTL